MADLRRTIARLLRRQRCRKGWTAERVARRAGVSVSTVQRYETGQSCDVSTAERIAWAMGLDLQRAIAEATDG